MRSEFQRQLEALGLQKTENSSVEKPQQKVIIKIKKKLPKPTSSSTTNSQNKRLIKLGTTKTQPLSKLEAKEIVERLHPKCGSWGSSEFSRAYECLTKKRVIPTYEQAQNTVRRWYRLESRVYELEYSIAVYVISGIWVSPKLKKAPKHVLINQSPH